jgi:hypothetical protein
MALIIRQATESDLPFAYHPARRNMAIYFARSGRLWNESIHRDSWPETENVVLLVDERSRILRLTQEGDALSSSRRSGC